MPLLNDAVQKSRVSREEAVAAYAKVLPAWTEVVRNANVLVQENRKFAEQSAKLIRESVRDTEVVLVGALTITLLSRSSRYLLYRSVTVPMARLVEVHDDAHRQPDAASTCAAATNSARSRRASTGWPTS